MQSMINSSHKRRRLSSSEKSSSETSEEKSPGLPASTPIARPRQQQQRSSFPRLPHELLVMIVDGVLVQDEPRMLHPKRRFNRKREVANSRSLSPLLSVLLACRALYFAGIEVFYGRNTLRFSHAVHLHTFVPGLSYDQRWCIGAIELNVEWVRGRNGQNWRPLHDLDRCSEWKVLIEQLPKLRSIVIRNVTKYGQSEMATTVDTGAFEAEMKREMGQSRAGMLTFVWPDQRVST